MILRSTLWRLGAVALVALLTVAARAEVVRVEIDQRGPFADGQAFGKAGAYERVVGRLFLEVDPSLPGNAVITDLQYAPRNARGRVEWWSDFYLLKPVDPQRGNGALLYDVNNRGNKLAVWTFNDARSNTPVSRADAGNGFLMEQGYSVLWCGWNGDVVEGDGRLLTSVPMARDGDRHLTGKIHVEICRDEKVMSQPFYWGPWGVSTAYPPVNPDHRAATLTMRPDRLHPAVVIPHDQWDFGRWEDGRLVSDPVHLYVKEGIRPGWLYELVYEGQDPRVTGLGLAAVRDCVSFFRYAKADSRATPNPLAGGVRRACIFGISQSGRFINEFLFDGFNTDESRRMVFDAALIHVAGSGRGQFNRRFGMTTLAGTAHENQICGSESFPFATIRQTDPITGRTGEIYSRCRAAGHLPKIMFTQTSTEYWTRGASLVHTDVQGRSDIALDPNVRFYSVAGAQHLGGTPAERGICQNLRNPLNDRGPVLRALLVALDRWVQAGQEPPRSRYPRIDNGTLVDLKTFRAGFPKIPGVNLPKTFYRPARLDFGPRWDSQGIADCVPPQIGQEYNTLVPAVDADGNERAGIRLPDVAVPLATYTGWNLRSKAAGSEKMLAPFHGSYLPFAQTIVEREAMGDPRPSIAERYPTREAYVTRVKQAAAELQRDRFLLESDAKQIIDAAANRDLPAMPGKAAGASRRRPNILLAISDDQSWKHAGAYGCRAVQTPAFDRVAREGVRFAQAFSAGPMCTVSRAALLTGRNIWQNREAGTHWSVFPRDLPVYPMLLEQAGYAVGVTGKGWGPGNWEQTGWPHNPAGPEFNRLKCKAPTTGIHDTDYAANFAAFLSEKDPQRPFCFWYGGSEPHGPVEKGSGVRLGKDPKLVELPPWMDDTPENRSNLLDIFVEIEWFDRHLGRMLEILQQRGELENTLVVVTGDNGTSIPHAKGNLYEYGVHVPLAVMWPAKIPAGRVVDDLVSFIDLAPTFLDAAGLPSLAGCAGRSLLGTLESNRGGRVDASRHHVLLGHERGTHERYDNLGYPMRAVRTQQYLYIMNLKPDRWPNGDPLMRAKGDKVPAESDLPPDARKRPAEQLFDIVKDEGCQKDLAGDPAHRAVKAELRRLLENELTRQGDPRLLGYGDIFESYPRFGAMRPQLGGFAERGQYNPKYHVRPPESPKAPGQR